MCAIFIIQAAAVLLYVQLAFFFQEPFFRTLPSLIFSSNRHFFRKSANILSSYTEAAIGTIFPQTSLLFFPNCLSFFPKVTFQTLSSLIFLSNTEFFREPLFSGRIQKTFQAGTPTIF